MYVLTPGTLANSLAEPSLVDSQRFITMDFWPCWYVFGLKSRCFTKRCTRQHEGRESAPFVHTCRQGSIC
jgi:hypothetical protein